jgi:hypothetical protein
LGYPEARITKNEKTMIIKGPYTPPQGTLEIMEIWVGNEIMWLDPKKDPELVGKFKEIMELAK